MKRAITARRQHFPGRRARLSVLLLAFLVLGSAVWLLSEVRSRHLWAEEALEQMAPRYARLAGLYQERDQIEAALLASREMLGRYSYSGEMSVDRVGTDLQQRVRAIAELAGMSVLDSRILPAQERGDFDIVAVSLRMRGDAVSLRDMVQALADEVPSIQLDVVSVSRAPGQGVAEMTVNLVLSVIRLRP